MRNFATARQQHPWLRSNEFAAGPTGIAFEPEEMAARLREAES